MEPDRAPGRLACLLPPGSTGAGWATSRATYHEPRCRARGCSTAHWQGGSHGLSCQARASTDRALWPTNRDGKSRSVAQAGWFGYVGHLVRLEGRAMLPALLLDRTKSGDRVTLTAIDSAPGQAP